MCSIVLSLTPNGCYNKSWVIFPENKHQYSVTDREPSRVKLGTKFLFYFNYYIVFLLRHFLHHYFIRIGNCNYMSTLSVARVICRPLVEQSLDLVFRNLR